ncbi:Rod shape-determining protein MreD [Acidisarcina polymorpha]|uniref:Rod shape-determining protein MreD n=1 Tax=Acidisarcina polymorpha TaxID=2211140 RepID=A0A2Z5G1X6_9BACT|nr:rod shape-determining protein MreD [Acidisarcina polymorpha]AXC13173.1 Rod shape-determining protein MreD [Acidisarcina polymorpha]
MPNLTATSRREVEEQSYPLFLYLLVPLLAIGLQSFITLHFARFAILDLPLLVTIYFAITTRNPIAATLTGTLIGVAQDALTHRPIGVNGIAKAIIGYLAASLGVRVDTENHATRLLLGFIFTVIHSAIFLLTTHRLLGLEVDWSWLHELIRGVVNALVAVVLFALLDRAKRRD